MKVPSPGEWQENLEVLLTDYARSSNHIQVSQQYRTVTHQAGRGLQALALLFACRHALTMPVGRDMRDELLRQIDEVTDGFEV